MYRPAVFTVLSLLLFSCTSSSSISKEVTADSSPIELSENDEVSVRLPDLVADLQPADIFEQWNLEFDSQTPDFGPACLPGEGCFGDDCLDNSQCQSGWCVEHMGEGSCTDTCQEECPAGWGCQAVGTGPDMVSICISPHANLCKPCQSSADCKSPGADDVCLSYGSVGSFCGGVCQVQEDCPWGFSCEDTMTVDDLTVTQCVAEAGECPCTLRSVELALWTPCVEENDWGTCAGKRVCTDEGLSLCSALTPEAEVCDGQDNDCDEEVDEPDLVDGEYVELCDDGNQCTEDSCLAEEGCVNEVQASGECSDDDPCTVADHCTQGSCLGEPVLCNDDNPCTDDICTATGGCEFPFNTQNCDDDNPCTLADQCLEGECIGVQMPCDCLSDEDCLELEDGDLCNGTLACDTGQLPHQCVVVADSVVTCPAPQGPDAVCQQASCDPASGDCSFVPDHEGWLCDDGDECTAGDSCQEGVCTSGNPINCNDGNPCTEDSCLPETGCLHTPNEADCNDSDACTTADTCSDGLCVGGPALSCDDGDTCNGQESCHPDTGCILGQPLDCDDENPCNGQEVCQPGSGCSSGQPLSCDDGNECTEDGCDPELGCTHIPLSDTVCSDGDACTTNDNCQGGECIGGPAEECGDDNPCTDSWCNPAQGCLTTLNEAPCDDGDLCTTGDHCHLGDCISSASLPCNDANPCTDDSCSPAAGCQFQPNLEDCDDGNECTVGDQCKQGQCSAGVATTCNDDDVCTDDTCSPETGCIFTHNQAPCDDNDICTLNDTCNLGLCEGTGDLACNDGNLCTSDSCSPEAGCLFVPNQAPCDDDNVCTAGDQCDEGWCKGGTGEPCDDQNVCTVDLCAPDQGCYTEAAEDGLPCGDTPFFQCTGGTCICHPDCTGLVCGEDGCGGSCGGCSQTQECEGGQCIEECHSLDAPAVLLPTTDTFPKPGLEHTFEGWFFLNPGGGEGLLFRAWEQCPAPAGMSVNSMPGDGNTNLLAIHGNPTGMSAKVPVSQGVWFHLAAVARANSLIMYIDGKKVATAPHLAGDLSICAAINAPMYLDGKVAGLRYSGVARYDVDFVPEVYLPVDGNSQGNWPMWEGEGTVLADSSGNGNDGTATDNDWSGDGPACTQGGLCGDGIQASWELCDDGNHVDDDGCQADCSIPLVPSVTMNGYTWYLAEKGAVCQTTCQALGKTCVDLVGANYVEASCSKAHAVCPNFFDGLPCVTDGDGPRVVYSGDTPVQCKWRNWNYPGMTCTYSAGGNTAHMCACQ